MSDTLSRDKVGPRLQVTIRILDTALLFITFQWRKWKEPVNREKEALSWISVPFSLFLSPPPLSRFHTSLFIHQEGVDAARGLAAVTAAREGVSSEDPERWSVVSSSRAQRGPGRAALQLRSRHLQHPGSSEGL